MAKESKDVRVLVDVQIEGADYKVNQVVRLSADLVASYKGAIDPSPAAVAYCVKELKQDVIEHRSPAAEGAAS